MSAPALAPAPVPVTAPIAASSLRPAPVRSENQPASFAEVLDETAPAETAPPARSAKPVKSADAPETPPTPKDAPESDTPVSADANVAPPAIVPPPVPTVVLAPAAETPATDDETPEADTAPQPLLLAASPGAAVQTGTVAPAPPPVAAPAPSAAPVASPSATPAPTTAAPSEEAATDTLDPDSAPVPAAPGAPPAPRLRDIIEHAASRSAASAQPQSGSTQSASTPADTDTASAAAAPASQSTSPEPSATAPKPAVDAPALAAVAADAAEPTQAIPTAPTAEARTNETTAQSPVLSTLSQGAIHATAQIAAQIVKKLEGRSTRFEMALTPDDLGRIDVSLDIDADGQLSARLAFDNPLAAADLRGRVDELRRQLTEAGFTVAEDALSFDQRDPSAGAGGFDRGPNSQSDRQSARAFGAASRLSLQAEASIVPPRWMSLTLTPERVDMKV